MRHLTPFLMILLVESCLARDWRTEIKALRPRDVSAQETALLDNLEQRARAALDAVPRAQTAHDADQARPELRRKLERALGLNNLPWPPKLNARVVGMLRRAGYRIEKIVYEALPGELIPAHLYVPERLEQPAPAVLFYNGHWWVDSKTKPDFQAFCINMARLGLVVLSFDPFGQGERGVSSRDHRRTEALLVGIAQEGFAEYETRCALEYLLSRPEVDAKRIGITGASGGGYNSWMTAALDDRIRVAVPVVGTSEFAEQIHVCRSLDWYHAAEHCHFVPGLIRFANNHELLAMAAPKPVLIVAATRDESFPLAGVREVAAYGRKLYESYQAPDKFGLVVDASESHGYQRKKREAAYGWFLRWLMNRGDGSPYPEPPTEPEPFDAEELRCFPPGQNQPAGPAMIEWIKRLACDLSPVPPRLDLKAVLGPSPKLPPAHVPIKEGRLQRLLIPSESGLEIPAFLLRPEEDARGVLIAIADRGKEAVASDPLFRVALDQGWAVCGVDPRGIGESATDKMGWVFAVSLLLNENFVGRQSWDLHRAIEAMSGDGAFPGKPIALYARGPNTVLAATYALAQPSGSGRLPIRGFVLRGGYVSYRAFFDRPKSMPASFRLLAEDRDRTTAFDKEIPAHFFAFDVLHAFDLPQLLASTSAEGLILDPIDGDGDVLSPLAARVRVPARVGIATGAEAAAKVRDLLRRIGSRP
jgi:dienelactone hydrolase